MRLHTGVVWSPTACRIGPICQCYAMATSQLFSRTISTLTLDFTKKLSSTTDNEILELFMKETSVVRYLKLERSYLWREVGFPQSTIDSFDQLVVLRLVKCGYVMRLVGAISMSNLKTFDYIYHFSFEEKSVLINYRTIVSLIVRSTLPLDTSLLQISQFLHSLVSLVIHCSGLLLSYQYL